MALGRTVLVLAVVGLSLLVMKAADLEAERASTGETRAEGCSLVLFAPNSNFRAEMRGA